MSSKNIPRYEDADWELAVSSRTAAGGGNSDCRDTMVLFLYPFGMLFECQMLKLQSIYEKQAKSSKESSDRASARPTAVSPSSIHSLVLFALSDYQNRDTWRWNIKQGSEKGLCRNSLTCTSSGQHLVICVRYREHQKRPICWPILSHR